MFVVITFIFLLAGLFSGSTDFFIIAGLFGIAGAIEMASCK